MTDMIIVRLDSKNSKNRLEYATFMGYFGETNDISLAIRFKNKKVAYERCAALNSCNSGGYWVAKHYDEFKEIYEESLDILCQ